jgi:hypothetical protein
VRQIRVTRRRPVAIAIAVAAVLSATSGAASVAHAAAVKAASAPKMISLSKYVDVLPNDPELPALRKDWASYLASQKGSPLPATPEVQAESWVGVCTLHSGLCPTAFYALENNIGTLGQTMPYPADEIAILGDVSGTQESLPGLRVPASAVASMALTGNVNKLARQFQVSTQKIRSAIESVKHAGLPRGGPVRNPDVVIDGEGEVYPLVSGIPAEDSIGNILDYIDSEDW